MSKKRIIKLKEHIIEIVSDSGEGAQKAAVTFAQACAMMGGGLWTVEVIPSEIQPPPHTTAATSGNRIRIAETPVTNAGDFANLVMAFNEMSLLSRIEQGVLADDVMVVIDNKWATDDSPQIRQNYREILDGVISRGGSVIEIPMEEETMKIIEDPTRGKNMFAVGVLAYLYDRNLEVLRSIISETFRSKAQSIIDTNHKLLHAGYEYADKHLDFQFQVKGQVPDHPQVVMNGNTALALGAISAGFKICSMYPITPATSASHELADIFEEFGGLVHQAEDEIAAMGTAIGSYYSGTPTITITSGPGMALKTELQGLCVMTETPLVLVDVQRGGPSTGLPTKIEQSDLLHALYGAPGDAPKVIMAASTIEECFHLMTTARKLAEEFRMLVVVLTDANLATGQQLYRRPDISHDNLPPPMDQNPVSQGTIPFDWDETTGLSRRIIPGQPNGMYVATGLNHGRDGKVRYDYASNQHGHTMRSRKLATLHHALKPPAIFGEEEGDLLLVGWGSTRGAIEEAVTRAREDGKRVSSINLQFISPLPPGLKDIFSRFGKVMTVELNYSDSKTDPLITEENRRYAQLAMVLRAQTLVDVDCYSQVLARPFMPVEIYNVINDEYTRLALPGGAGKAAASAKANLGAD
ncbi:MAG: 2-oxoacid:acceptor oxidoreductase subunit alpha [Deltaproteobacteria bacterium]|nr:2-oxoacid:acceptor oxidoreductase subunit alpha [Deltaproteobacteria bacterium]